MARPDQIIEVHSAAPYAEPYYIVVPHPKLPNTDRSLPFWARRQLKEICRKGSREGGGTPLLDCMTSRSRIGKIGDPRDKNGI